MGYGHAERNLALIRLLEAETRELLGTLGQPDPEQSAWLQEVTSPERRVAGVTDVHNPLEVVLPDSDYRDDAMLTAAANNALTLNVTVPHRQPGDEEVAAICLLAADVSERRRSRFY
jgi:hypothetical protein